jgi:hypothetical protein
MATTLKGKRKGKSIGAKVGDGKIAITAREEYVVISNVIDEDEITVLKTTGLPILGLTVHASGSVCSGLSAKQDEVSPYKWLVSADYEDTPTQEEDPGDPGGGPLTWFPIWKGTLETEDWFSEVDAYNRPIQTPAKTWFDQPIQSAIPVVAHVFHQYEDPATTIEEIAARNNTVNDDTVKTYAKWQLKLIVRDFELGTMNDEACWKINYELRYKKGIPGANYVEFDGTGWDTATDYSGWREMRLAVSSHQLVSGIHKPCTAYGRPIANGKVDKNGVQIAATSPPVICGIDRLLPIDFSAFLRGI